MWRVNRPCVDQLYRRLPWILPVDGIQTGRRWRHLDKNPLHLDPADNQKRNAEQPAPAYLDSDEQRPVEDPTHLPHQRLRPAQRSGHRTTRFTSLRGTTITFTTVLPAMRACTFSSVSAAA